MIPEGLNILVYLIFGEAQELENQCLFSIVSINRNSHESNNREYEIIVLSDRPREKLTKSSINCIVLDQDTRNDWEYEEYFLKVKIHAIKYILKRCKAKVIFVDTDTIFKCEPMELFKKIKKNSYLLHTEEQEAYNRVVGSESWRQIELELARRKAVNGIDTTINGISTVLSSPMFNTGVIGICFEDVARLDDALAVLSMFVRIDSTVRLIEQFSLSLVFHQTGLVDTCKGEVLHYWHEKDVYQNRIDTYLASGAGIKEYVERYPHVESMGVPPETVINKYFYRILNTIRNYNKEERQIHNSYRRALKCGSSDRILARFFSDRTFRALKQLSKAKALNHAAHLRSFQEPVASSLVWMDRERLAQWQNFWQELHQEDN